MPSFKTLLHCVSLSILFISPYFPLSVAIDFLDQFDSPEETLYNGEEGLECLCVFKDSTNELLSVATDEDGITSLIT
jgi:hypothetical protein